MTPPVARLAVLLVLVVAAVASAAYWIVRGIPVDVVAAPTSRISCVSYAPYRKVGESPFTKGYRVTAERIEEDLAALSRRFDCVRTYSVGQGLDQVPAIARRHGMKVLLGAWLSRDPIENAEELQHAIDVANRERDTIRAIVVGNEVLLRGELPQRTIAEHLRAVKAATGLPVTYADVWEFWLKYREVAPAVDFITIHILPYWEDKPVAIEHAIEHVDAIYRHMQAAFPDREFLIGETGWPSVGRQRWQAVPSRVNEARFFREFMVFIERAKLPYNVIEAFDQPWKRQLEGTVGGYWGLYDDDLRDKFPLEGPVTEDERWWVGLLVGGIGLAAFVIAGWIADRRRRARVGLAAVGVRALAGFFIGATSCAQVVHFDLANRNAFEWVLMTGITAIGVATSIFVIEQVTRRVARLAIDLSPPSCAPMAVAWSWRLASSPMPRWNGALQSFWLVAAVVVDLLLVFDARYRDFPSLLFAPVVVAFVALALAARRPADPPSHEVEERLLAGALVAGAMVLVAMELPINGTSDLWAALTLLFAGAAWRNVDGSGRDGR